MYTTSSSDGVTRVVNNAPFSGVRRAERDAAVAGVIEREIAAFRPDIVHVQHAMFLDTSFRCDVPMVWTIHDAWGWCAAGGSLVRDDAACSGPSAACARCASAWCHDAPAVDRALDIAGILGRVVPPSRMHRTWQSLPASFRSLATRPGRPVTQSQVDARHRALREFAGRCAAVVSPSRWYAAEAERHGLGKPWLLPHGVEIPTARRVRETNAPLIFLGTIARQKGPDLVRAAHARSGVRVELRVYGPPGPDPAYVLGVPNEGPCPDVAETLAGARALVMGSIWPENAPLVILEARAAGCPVIAPKIGGIPEILEDGVDGLLYPPGDVDALSTCMKRLASREFSPRVPPSFNAHLDALQAIYAPLLPPFTTPNHGR